MTDIELIKSRLDIADIIGEYIQLKPAGANLKASCPFHDEKTPSFMVHRGKQIFHCFGCNTGGDMFTFLQKYENLEFPEALRILAGKAGVTLKAFNPEHESLKTKLKDILDAAVRFYEHQLWENIGVPSREYLTIRGLSEETIRTFRLGFAPKGWEHLSRHLKNKKFNDHDILQSGLVIQKNESSRYYDRFRERIMFPIMDTYGQTIGFSGRLLPQSEKDEKTGGKYINTPETPLYHKAHIWYGLHLAKHAIKKNNAAVIVEGQMDVIASHQANVMHTIASSGTALTNEQFKILKRLTENTIFALDQDAAGIDAFKRAIVIAWEHNLNVHVASFPPSAKDPADVAVENPSQLQEIIRRSKPAMAHWLDHILSKISISSASDKKKASQEILPLLAQLPDPIERSHYIDEMAHRLNINTVYIHEALKKLATPKQSVPLSNDQSTSSIQQTPAKNSEQQYTKLIFALALSHPSIAHEWMQSEKNIDFIQATDTALYTLLRSWYNQNKSNQPFHLEKKHELAKKVSMLELLGEKEFGHLSAPETHEEFRRLFRLREKILIQQQLKTIEQQLKQAESSGNSAEHLHQLAQQFNTLAQQLKQI